MKFNNRQNKCLKTVDGGEVWNSRSVAVVGMILMRHEGEIYVLIGKRGEALPNEVGKYCMPCGFLDFDETCEEAVVREVYEETGLNLNKLTKSYTVVYDHLHFPWRINSEPDNKVQTVSMHYAICLEIEKGMGELPELNLDNNIDPTEVSEIKWVNINKLNEYDFAFGHDKVIRIFVNSFI